MNKDNERFINEYGKDNIVDFIYNSNAIEYIEQNRFSTEGWIDILLDEDKYGIPKEIIGQFGALKWALDNCHDDIDINWLHQVHRLLMNGLLPDQYHSDYPGILRGNDVPVPGSPEFSLVPILITEFFQDLKEQLNIGMTEKEVYHNHCIYETIHPYPDGNGRSGRILWEALRIRLKYPFKIMKYIDRDIYIKSLNECRENIYQKTCWYP